jgi:hypothetical protein
MAVRKHESDADFPSLRAFFVPLGWILALLASYWLITDWQSVPALISATFAAIG